MRFEQDDFGVFAVRLDDHAEDAKVCAAVSALAMTMIGMLKQLGVHFNRCYYNDGKVDIDVSPFNDDTERLKVSMVFHTILFGFRQLEKNYPNNITVSGDKL